MPRVRVLQRSLLAPCLLLLGVLSVSVTGCGKSASTQSTAPPQPTADVIAPAALQQMQVASVEATSVLITWLASGDDRMTGLAHHYEVRVANTDSIVGDWESMRVDTIGVPSPGVPGTLQSVRVYGLGPGSEYMFAVRVYDEAGNYPDTMLFLFANTPGNKPGPHVTVVTNNNGIWKTSTGGYRWEQADVSDHKSAFAGIAGRMTRTPPELYAHTGQYSGGAGQAEIYRSVDGGAYWSPLGTTAVFLYGGSCRAICPSPTTPGLLYAAVSNYCADYPYNNCASQIGAVYRSVDDGLNWTEISAGLPPYPSPTFPGMHSAMNAIALGGGAPTTLYVGGYDLNSDTNLHCIYRSTSMGQSWEKSGWTLDYVTVHAMAVDPSNPSRLVASTSSGMYLSTDGASSWTLQDASGGGAQVLFDPTSAARVYTLSSRSVDGGATWTPFTTPAGSGAALAVDARTGDLYAAGTGVHRSSDGGSTWRQISTLSGCRGLVVWSYPSSGVARSRRGSSSATVGFPSR